MEKQQEQGQMKGGGERRMMASTERKAEREKGKRFAESEEPKKKPQSKRDA